MQQVGSDTFPRDEVTGLAAFDNLDPVSTLNMMPEEVAPLPRVFAPPPPPVGTITQPPPRYAPSPRGGATLPPPMMPAPRTFNPPSVAPPMIVGTAPAGLTRPDESQTVEVSGAPGTDSAHEGWDDPDDAETRVERPLLEGAGVPAAHLQMDWDDDELPTQMRGEGGMPRGMPRGMPQTDTGWQPSTHDDLETAAFEPVPATTPSGRPSPFPSVRTNDVATYAPAGSVAPTAYVPSVRPGAPSPFSTTTEAGVDSAWGEVAQGEKRTFVWVAIGAVAIIALGFGARAFLAPPTPGLVTLTTVPADARVTIDGRPVSATSSPFSASDLTPGASHELVVQKDGFVEERTTFTLRSGEAKSLPEIKLAAAVRNNGFAITSTPAGADVLVDGHSVGQVTPARVLHATPGLHKLELSHEGYKTFELQVYVPDNAVLELPNVELTAGKAHKAADAPEAEPVAAAAAPTKAEHHSHHSHGAATHAASAAVSAPRFASHASNRAPSVASKKTAAAVSAPSAAAGKGGILRVNSRPWAQVFVDNKLIGNTPQLGIQLGAGNHNVKLVNQPMGLTKTFSVSVKTGQTVTKIMNLIE